MLAHVFKISCALCVLKIVLKFLSAEIHFVITFVSVLKSVDKENVFESVFEMCKCRKFVLFEQASNNYLLVLENIRSFPPIL